MTSPERIAVACIIASAAIMLGGFWLVRSFGCYALDRIVRTIREEGTWLRQSEEATRHSVSKMVDEVCANRNQQTLEAELSLERFIARVEKIHSQRSA
jgi:hypothetical protein